jgi:hypothetical protein
VTRLRSLRPILRTTETRTIPPPPKIKDPVYDTPQFRVWRAHVVQRAGARCEALDAYGLRCTRAYPEYRMYADHVKELRDGGSLLDLNNGQCLCRSHHEYKTIKERIRRLTT